MKQYEQLLEDQTFMSGDSRGRLETALTVLTDMLVELNALEIYYAKPGAKSLVPPQIADLREKIEYIKQIIRASLLRT